MEYGSRMIDARLICREDVVPFPTYKSESMQLSNEKATEYFKNNFWGKGRESRHGGCRHWWLDCIARRLLQPAPVRSRVLEPPPQTARIFMLPSQYLLGGEEHLYKIYISNMRPTCARLRKTWEQSREKNAPLKLQYLLLSKDDKPA